MLIVGLSVLLFRIIVLFTLIHDMMLLPILLLTLIYVCIQTVILSLRLCHPFQYSVSGLR